MRTASSVRLAYFGSSWTGAVVGQKLSNDGPRPVRQEWSSYVADDTFNAGGGGGSVGFVQYQHSGRATTIVGLGFPNPTDSLTPGRLQQVYARAADLGSISFGAPVPVEITPLARRTARNLPTFSLRELADNMLAPGLAARARVPIEE